MPARLVKQISSLLKAIENCKKNNNESVGSEWLEKHTERLDSLCKNHLPSGAGFDSGTNLDMDKSNSEKLVFHTSFHHMNESGYYDGWTDHTVTVTPGFDGVHIRISGRNRNDIKDYILQTFEHCLNEEVPL